MCFEWVFLSLYLRICILAGALYSWPPHTCVKLILIDMLPKLIASLGFSIWVGPKCTVTSTLCQSCNSFRQSGSHHYCKNKQPLEGTVGACCQTTCAHTQIHTNTHTHTSLAQGWWNAHICTLGSSCVVLTVQKGS